MKFRPLLGSDLSGSIAAITASHNKGGPYFRNRAIPINPNTPEQQTVRDLLTQLSTAWSDTLTTAQQTAWETYAINTPLLDTLGEARIIPALSMYVRSNLPRLQAGLARVDAGPVTFGLPGYTAPSVASSTPATPSVDITLDNTDGWANETGGALLIWISRPTGLGINFFKGPYRFAGSVLGDTTTPPTSPATITTPFPFAVGNRLFLRANAVTADGRLGAETRFQHDA